MQEKAEKYFKLKGEQNEKDFTAHRSIVDGSYRCN